MERIALNLGAGNKIISDAVNHDLTKHRPEIDIAWDLNNIPWPWEDDTFTYILANAVLEHLEIDLLKSMNECHRILKPNGELTVKLPYWNHEASYEDPTHYWVFSPGVFDLFDPETYRGQHYGFYTPRKWKILGCNFVDSRNSAFRAVLRALK